MPDHNFAISLKSWVSRQKKTDYNEKYNAHSFEHYNRPLSSPNKQTKVIKAKTVEHDANDLNVIGSITRESKNWKNVSFEWHFEEKSINVNVYMTSKR